MDGDYGRQRRQYRKTHVANSVISAVGQLNRPKLPDIDGIESFSGQWCHSAALGRQH